MTSYNDVKNILKTQFKETIHNKNYDSAGKQHDDQEIEYHGFNSSKLGISPLTLPMK